MSTWNYRVVRYRDGSAFGLHEVYYNDDGEPWTMTEDPCSFVCEAEEGSETVVEALKMALKDAESRPVLDEPEKWAEPSESK